MNGSTLRNLRQKARLNQHELAIQVHVGQGHLSRIERGLATPSPALVERLRNILAPQIQTKQTKSKKKESKC